MNAADRARNLVRSFNDGGLLTPAEEAVLIADIVRAFSAEPAPMPAPVPQVPELRFTQIAVSPGQGNRDCLYALASDSSIWRLAIQHDNELWIRLPSLPPAAIPMDPTLRPAHKETETPAEAQERELRLASREEAP